MKVRLIELEATPEETAVIGSTLQAAGFQVQARPSAPVEAAPLPTPAALPAPTPPRKPRVAKPQQRKEATAAGGDDRPVTAIGQKVLDLIGPGRAMSISEIADELEYRDQSVRPQALGRTLSALVDRGRLEKVSGGRWKVV